MEGGGGLGVMEGGEGWGRGVKAGGREMEAFTPHHRSETKMSFIKQTSIFEQISSQSIFVSYFIPRSFGSLH